MSGTGRHSIFPAVLVGGSTINVRQLHGQEIMSGVTKDIVIPGGAIDPAAIPALYADPRVRLRSYDLYTLLTGISPTAGFTITAASRIQWQQRTENGTFEGSGAHVYYGLTKGCAYLGSLASQQDGAAELSFIVVPLFDGTNAILTANTSASLSSTPTFTSKYYHGPAYVNGSPLLNVIANSVDFGINYQTNREGGDTVPRTGAIYTRSATMSVTVANAAIAATSGLFNNSLPGAFAVYFRKGVSGGDRVADATAEHAKVSGSSGVWNTDQMSVQDNGDGTSTVSVQFTGTIATSVASAIGG